jgi:hypothetical protein
MRKPRRGSAQRKQQDGHYTAIHNSVLTDPSLSLAAFRVLMYLATKPDGWTVQTADIMKALELSRHAVREVARPELVEAGYLKTEDIRDSGGKVIRRETSVIRPLVVYLGKSAGQNLRREIPDAGKTRLLVTTDQVVTTEVVTSNYGVPPWFTGTPVEYDGYIRAHARQMMDRSG